MRQVKGFLAWGAAVGIVILGLSSKVSAAGNVATGKELYAQLCTRCHGEKGKGDGPEGILLAAKPRNFTDCARMHTINDEELVTVIREGGPARHLSKDMPEWGNDLQDQQIADLVAYIRSFCAHRGT